MEWNGVQGRPMRRMEVEDMNCQDVYCIMAKEIMIHIPFPPMALVMTAPRSPSSILNRTLRVEQSRCCRVREGVGFEGLVGAK